MWGTGSNKMISICCTICEVQIACKFIDMLKIYCFARKNECTGSLLALHANNWLYGRIFHNSRIFLQNINLSDRIRFKTAQYCRFVSKFCQVELAYRCIEMLNKRKHAEQEVVGIELVTDVPPNHAARLLSTVTCQELEKVA